ncbi:MAG: 3-hydroxyacyl-CoA dehydrogenase NAD-binding domain-containing protein, partial [Pseudomonadota bacterium]|nr:3-hydroxyacyl-CoA dehydrogenase NAD-binding domain-containing protein [Pseudomonadota bacterium]
MSCFEYNKDADNIVTLTINMDGKVNIINQEFTRDLLATVQRLEAERATITGVILTSAKSTFIAGADLKFFAQFSTSDIREFSAMVNDFKNAQRRLEQLTLPVVCALNGTALGAGFELALACHHRIAINDTKNIFGLPEESFGLLPGGGGTTRLIHLLGLKAALPLILEARKLRADLALTSGIIDDIATDSTDMLQKARTWIRNNPTAQQPWDKPDYSIDKKELKILAISPAVMLKKTRGAFPAAKTLLALAKEILTVDFDTALKIESRAFIKLLLSPEAHNMITTFYFGLNALKAGGSRPKEIPPQHTTKIGILGAGMMGRGIAYAAAIANIDVTLLDSTLLLAQKGKTFSEKLLENNPKKAEILARITPTEKIADLAGCDLIIEAVFENVEIKAQITRAAEPQLAANGVFASNTSTLPISLLADASTNPENFIGIHFFSPVEKMPLIEI